MKSSGTRFKLDPNDSELGQLAADFERSRYLVYRPVHLCFRALQHHFPHKILFATMAAPKGTVVLATDNSEVSLQNF